MVQSVNTQKKYQELEEKLTAEMLELGLDLV